MIRRRRSKDEIVGSRRRSSKQRCSGRSRSANVRRPPPPSLPGSSPPPPPPLAPLVHQNPGYPPSPSIPPQSPTRPPTDKHNADRKPRKLLLPSVPTAAQHGKTSFRHNERRRRSHAAHRCDQVMTSSRLCTLLPLRFTNCLLTLNLFSCCRSDTVCPWCYVGKKHLVRNLSVWYRPMFAPSCTRFEPSADRLLQLQEKALEIALPPSKKSNVNVSVDWRPFQLTKPEIWKGEALPAATQSSLHASKQPSRKQTS